MKRLILTAAVVLTTFATIFAQGMNTGNGHNPTGALEFQVGYRNYNMDQLNSALVAGGLPAMNDNNIWLSVGMAHVYKKWLMEDGIGITTLTSTNANDVRTRFNQYELYFKLGYNISNSDDYRLYPFAGLNFNAAVLNIQDNRREQNVSNFSQELLNSTSSKTLYQPNFGIDLGLGFDYLIKMKTKQMDCIKIERNIPIGIRAGYYFNTYAADWRINDYNLNNSPTNKQSAVFVTLNIGLGYKVSK